MPLKQPIASNTKTFPTVGGEGIGFSTSGTTSANTTANWRIHIQNVEIMYERVTQYKTTDGTVDFNYLDVAYTADVTREHIYWNAPSGDNLQRQTLTLVSDDASGSMGLSGVIKTEKAGIFRREVREGDVESQVRISGNVIADKQPGAYEKQFDTSGNTNSVILDILTGIKLTTPDYELNLVDL
tara:strand:- start:108 stop:659 length:552 start_codon:yes stop_codon:yes gene_type:complete